MGAQNVRLVLMDDGSDPRLTLGMWVAIKCDCCMDVNIFKVPNGFQFGDAGGLPMQPTGQWVEAEGVHAELYASVHASN